MGLKLSARASVLPPTIVDILDIGKPLGYFRLLPVATMDSEISPPKILSSEMLSTLTTKSSTTGMTPPCQQSVSQVVLIGGQYFDGHYVLIVYYWLYLF